MSLFALKSYFIFASARYAIWFEFPNIVSHAHVSINNFGLPLAFIVLRFAIQFVFILAKTFALIRLNMNHGPISLFQYT